MKFQMKAIIYHPALQEKIDALNKMPHKMVLVNIMEDSDKTIPGVDVEEKDPSVIIFTAKKFFGLLIPEKKLYAVVPVMVVMVSKMSLTKDIYQCYHSPMSSVQ